MNTKIKELKESISIKGNEITIIAFMAMLKDGEHYVYTSPTFLVNGYGKTEKEAYESYLVCMEVFCDDMLAADSKERTTYLENELGFVKKEKETFSKMYVDSNGILRDLSNSEVISTSMIEIDI
jgi:hypothetical protein